MGAECNRPNRGRRNRDAAATEGASRFEFGKLARFPQPLTCAPGVLRVEWGVIWDASAPPGVHDVTVLRDELQRTLGDTYTLERELGGGGMSTVFVARDNALGAPSS